MASVRPTRKHQDTPERNLQRLRFRVEYQAPRGQLILSLNRQTTMAATTEQMTNAHTYACHVRSTDSGSEGNPWTIKGTAH